MTHTPRTITNDELKAAARKAIDDGTLLALAPGFSGACFYEAEIDGKTYNCAIGAALTPSEIKEIQRNGMNFGASADTLKNHRIVLFENGSFANKVQFRHDLIDVADPESVSDFKSLIDYSEAGAV